jgi:hypothetical protein
MASQPIGGIYSFAFRDLQYPRDQIFERTKVWDLVSVPQIDSLNASWLRRDLGRRVLCLGTSSVSETANEQPYLS